jgi:hypothetical protein
MRRLDVLVLSRRFGERGYPNGSLGLFGKSNSQQGTAGAALCRLSPNQEGQDLTVIYLGGPRAAHFSCSGDCHNHFNKR